MKYARMNNQAAVDVRTESPEGFFTPNVVAEFVTVPEEVEDGWMFDGEVWAEPVQIEPNPADTPVIYPQLTPLEFKMCFTVTERLAIKAAKETDPILQDTYEILDDVRLKTVDLNLASNRALIDYLVSLGCITIERAEEVKSGVQL